MPPRIFEGIVRFLNFAVVRKLSFGEPTIAVISGGAITYEATHMRVDTEGAAASDNLDAIYGGNAGDILILRTVSDARDVAVRDAQFAGAQHNIELAGNFTLSNDTDTLMLMCRGPIGGWIELSRSDTAA